MRYAAEDVIAGRKRWVQICGDSLKVLRKIPSGTVQCVITSVPYYALRDYGVDGQIGLEKTPSKFIKILVRVFREIRRVLRDDGTCFINIGDTYHCKKGQAGGVDKRQPARRHHRTNLPNDAYLEGLKAKDMIGIPWMLAFALRDDGWHLRGEMIWHKPNAMAESVKDRFSRDHEQVFLLSKSPRYFFDFIATQVPSKTAGSRSPNITNHCNDGAHNSASFSKMREQREKGSFQGKTATKPGQRQSFRAVGLTRNLRTVWKIPTRKYKGAHFAVFPPDLVKPCLRAGTSEHGCCSACRAPIVRVWESKRIPTRPGLKTKISRDRKTGAQLDLNGKPWASAEVGNRDPERHITAYETVGWKPTCSCGAPARGMIVLDPFAGSGTVLQVALEHGQDAIGIDLSPDYCRLVADRMAKVTPSLRPE